MRKNVPVNPIVSKHSKPDLLNAFSEGTPITFDVIAKEKETQITGKIIRMTVGEHKDEVPVEFHCDLELDGKEGAVTKRSNYYSLVYHTDNSKGEIGAETWTGH